MKDKNKTRGVRLASAVGVLAVVGAGGIITAPAAQAVGVGPGIQGTYGFIGALVQDGYGNVFCVDSSLDVPMGMNPIADNVVSYLPANPAVTNSKDANADDLGRMNYILSTWGDSGDPETAAAAYVAMDAYLKTGGLGESLSYTGGNANVDALATSMWQQSQGITIGGAPVSGGSGTLSFDVNPQNNYVGTVTMVGSAGAVGTITLTNGVFDLTGTNTLTGATEGTAYAVHGVPPTEDGAPYKISGEGDFQVGAGDVWPGELRILDYGGGVQRTARAIGSQPGQSNFHVNGSDPTDRSVKFQPVLTTTATRYLNVGDAFSDIVNFSTVADATGLNNDWFKSSKGNYAPVHATGTVYGGFASDPAANPLDTPPADAPVAGHMEVTTDLATGPTVPYSVTSQDKATTPGWYTYVWAIDSSAQDAGTQNYIPSPYNFTDKFGAKNESSVVPSDISAVSQVTKPAVALSEVAKDTLTVSANGMWLQGGESGPGKNNPVKFHGTAYYVPKADIPEGGIKPSQDVPSYAKPLGSVDVTATSPGKLEIPDGVKAPATGEGKIVWQWEIRPQDQENPNLVKAWKDDFGVPTEMQDILQPSVKTQAQPGTKKGGVIKDTAIVGDTLPDGGAQLTFEAYTVPTKDDGTGKKVVDAPAGTKAGDLSWVCTDKNRLYDGTKTPTIVTKTGSYPSADVKVDDYAKVLWVEKLWSNPGEGKKPELIKAGECGILTETSFVVDVTTKAVTDGSNITDVENGIAVNDTVKAVGWVPEGGKSEVDVFLTDKGAAPVCEAAVATLPVADNLEGGLYTAEKPLELKTTQGYVYNGDPSKQLYFVEKLYDKDGRLVSHGECGDQNETAGLQGKKVLATGGAIDYTPFYIGGGALLLVIAGAVSYLIYRNRKSASVAAVAAADVEGKPDVE
ncbi:hypothetical protein [Microbacterium sp. 13-71-7]|uniref:hypothetical protein n=1 Tax=Microbacterium sp. 13-71-7 TaxID=1970399 RepID=UPI000BD909BC|nr:hypothetical protein [Microbacterium sp. 13-71-7]OZB85062.1 MAG: hypothetical protein B7X32_04910 [Microbacterium sp. 13-71-7]